MSANKTVTVSARVSPRTRRVAEAAAEIRGLTLSQFAAEAIAEAARRELVTEPMQPRSGEAEEVDSRGRSEREDNKAAGSMAQRTGVKEAQ